MTFGGASDANAPLSQQIIVDDAQQRMWEIFERKPDPQTVKNVLGSSLNGMCEQQERIFKAMFDTWPRLQKNVGELQRAATKAPWKPHPYAEEGEKPAPDSVELSKQATAALWSSRPDVTRNHVGLRGLIANLALQYWTGIGVHEVLWKNDAGEWRPSAYKELPARYYGYPNIGTGEDRLMLRPDGGYSMDAVDFPEHRFVIAMRGGFPGHPTQSAPIRVLTTYWLAAVFGLQWFMQYAQLFGVPIRWATYAKDDKNAREEVIKLVKNIGSSASGVAPDGTKLNLIESAKAAAALPQAELLKLADEQCDIFILGQTLTSSVSKDGGSRALGEVHNDVRQDVIEGMCDFIGEIITTQLIPAWARWNFGRVPDHLPEFYPHWPPPKNEKEKADRADTVVNKLKLPVGKAWLYEDLGIPVPAEDEEVFTAAGVEPPPVAGLTAAKQSLIAAADWSRFADTHGGLGIPRADMPQIKAGNRASMVQYLRARGVEVRRESVLPATLKATQAEFSQEKVDAAKGYAGRDRSILVSLDGHVVDGHHQWLAALQGNPKQPIKVIRLMAPIRYVLDLVKAMPSTTTDPASQPGKPAGLEAMFKKLRDSDPDAIAEKLTQAMNAA